jgi:hypothetical protein
MSEQSKDALAAPVEAVATEPVAVRQLGGAPDDLHNLIKVVCATMTIEQIGELCREVISRRNPSLTAPTGDSGALREALALARDTLDEAEEELRMIRMKDSAAVYNTTLRSLGFGLARQKIDAALKGEPGK